MKFILTSIAITVAGILVYHYLFTDAAKSAFIHNQKVFDEFKGKLELEERLNHERNENRKLLDSIQLLIMNGRTDLKDIFDERAYTLKLQEEERSARYTADIWRFINESIAEYGEKHGYDYIMGASGNGSLMFASPKADITLEIIKYCNERYSGENIR